MKPPAQLSVSERLPPARVCRLIVESEERSSLQGFLIRVSRRLRALEDGGVPSESFVYDEVERRSLDAVVVLAHFDLALLGRAGRAVILRSAHRPPVILRKQETSPVQEPEGRVLWELPAGLVEVAESTAAGVRSAARRELFEETGFSVKDDALRELGPSTFPCPGVIAERHFFFEVEVDPSLRGEPELDGSVLERFGDLVALPLELALAACRTGEIADAKTELCLRRFQERYA